jgi:hypothetical protein
VPATAGTTAPLARVLRSVLGTPVMAKVEVVALEKIAPPLKVLSWLKTLVVVVPNAVVSVRSPLKLPPPWSG